MGRYAKLVMVTGENNNKFYSLTENNGKIDVEYGRIDATSTKIQKSIHEWDRLVASKIKKGYKDVTHLASVTIDEKELKEELKTVKIDNDAVEKFISTMKAYMDGLVKATYSVKATSVSKAQVDEAQKIINKLRTINAKKKESEFNNTLLELYTVIPRYMGHVSSYLLPHFDVERGLQQEQDNLDAMAAQVSMLDTKPSKKKKEDKKKTQNILDVMGISMKECKVNKDIKYLIDQVEKGTSRYGRIKVNKIFEVNKPSEDKIFEEWLSKAKDKSTRILIHGTRCTSVIPILEQGLKIRPVGNYQFSGKAFGDGNYYSEVVDKSLGYTGYDNDKVLLVYEVHTGNPFTYNGWYKGNSFTLNYKELSSRGYDSTYVKAGNGMLNSEIIAYREEQCRIKYLIHLKS